MSAPAAVFWDWRAACLMIGGDRDTVAHLDPIFAALAPGAGDIPRTPGRKARDPRVELGICIAGRSAPGISSR
jgi:6-phosphogluconate dehydrogenase